MYEQRYHFLPVGTAINTQAAGTVVPDYAPAPVRKAPCGCGGHGHTPFYLDLDRMQLLCVWLQVIAAILIILFTLRRASAA